MPTSIWAYIGAALGSSLRRDLNCAARMCLDLGGDVADQAGEGARRLPGGLSRTRMRKPSVESST
jgi:hypothetical protein